MYIHDEHEDESMDLNERLLWASGHGVLLLLMLAGIAFVSGYWTIFLALGPAAYLLILEAHSSANAPTKVAISHGAALVIGWVAYWMIAQGITPMTVEPMSEPGLRLVGSALVTFAGIMIIFYVLHTRQPMAFVAGFTTAIGALPTIQSLIVAVTAVLLMAGLQAIRRRYGPEFSGSSGQTDAWSFET